MAEKKAYEDYLEAILILEQRGEPVHSIEVAKLLSVSRPAVSQAMNALIVGGYIDKPNYCNITLNEKGREVAQNTYARHIAIKAFLIKIGVSESVAEIDACKIEHIISEETLVAIKRQL